MLSIQSRYIKIIRIEKKIRIDQKQRKQMIVMGTKFIQIQKMLYNDFQIHAIAIEMFQIFKKQYGRFQGKREQG